MSEDSSIGKGRHLRSKELREVASSVRNGTFTYEARPKKSVDWATYDEAQINELADMLNSIRDIVDEARARLYTKERREKFGKRMELLEHPFGTMSEGGKYFSLYARSETA